MVKKIKSDLKYVKIKDILDILILILVLIPSLIYKLYLKITNKKIWLICEAKDTARDNGYHLFKYIRINYPKDNVYYAIDKKSLDYQKLREYGNVIQFRSLKHWIYYLCASLNISTQKYGNPSPAIFYVLHIGLVKLNNRVFLQHGITKDDASWLYYDKTKFKLFICGAKKEYEYVKEKFNYPINNVAYLGFSRFDNLYDNNVNNKQILIMPTWRTWLGRETNILNKKEEFKKSEYYIKWNSLLKNKELIKYIEKEKITIYFYPHMNMHEYIKDFKVISRNIKIVSKEYDIQKLLKESALLVTDYSSVYMDFAYMSKPIIYYQFDSEKYRRNQLQEGYFKYSKNAFGKILIDEEDVVNRIIGYSKMNYKVEPIYLKRMNEFFELKDQKNSERIYNHLKNIG